MRKLTTDTSNNDEDANDTFVERALNMIDKKHNGCFLSIQLPIDVVLTQLK